MSTESFCWEPCRLIDTLNLVTTLQVARHVRIDSLNAPINEVHWSPVSGQNITQSNSLGHFGCRR